MRQCTFERLRDSSFFEPAHRLPRTKTLSSCGPILVTPQDRSLHLLRLRAPHKTSTAQQRPLAIDYRSSEHLTLYVNCQGGRAMGCRLGTLSSSFSSLRDNAVLTGAGHDSQIASMSYRVRLTTGLGLYDERSSGNHCRPPVDRTAWCFHFLDCGRYSGSYRRFSI